MNEFDKWRYAFYIALFLSVAFMGGIILSILDTVSEMKKCNQKILELYETDYKGK